MQRRSFFRYLFGMAGTVAVGAVAGKVVPLPVVASRRRLRIQTSPVAGFQYHEGERLWSRLQVGDALELVREPGNEYDSQAVRVDWDGRKIGYVPRYENTAVAQMLDRGEALTAEISALAESGDPWERVEVTIEAQV